MMNFPEPPPAPPAPPAAPAADLEPRPRRLLRWWQVTAGALSGILIAGALAVVFIAGFLQAAAPASTPVVLSAPAGQHAPQLPATSSCLSTRAHRCPRSPLQTPKPTPGPGKAAPK